ncbi:hypothetical protein GCM10009093_04350 [Brevundimonas terrae]|uniref:Uncharacterized protein n=1 Tax=Brevundimonas terrae TaxID=363631 RepID=A0ABN0Y205_9CAUL
MRGGKTDRGQAGHIGNQGRARDAGSHIVDADRNEQGVQVMALSGQPGKDQIGNRAHKGPDQHGADQSETGHHRPAHKDTQRHGNHAENLADLADFQKAEPQIQIEGVHDVQNEIGQAIKADQRKDRPGQLAETDEEILHRRTE